MIKALRTTMLCVLLAACNPETNNNDNHNDAQVPVVLVVVAGGENAVGLVHSSTLDATAAQLPPNVELWVDGAQAGAFDEHPTFGPEVALAKRLSVELPEATVIVSKTARGPASLHGAWCPTEDATRLAEGHDVEHVYPLMLQHADTAAAGRVITDAAMLWVHGERDAQWQHTATAYGQNLEVFLGAAREALELGPVAVVAIKLDLMAHDYEQHVRAAQLLLDEPWATVLDGQLFDYQAGGVHYSSAGLDAIGTAAASAILGGL